MTPDEQKLVADAVKSPLDKAMNGRTRRRDPALEALVKREAKERELPSAPIDYDPATVIGASPGAESARTALGQLFTTWNVVEAAAKDTSIPREELGRVAEQAVKRGLAGADVTLKNLDQLIKNKQVEIDNVLMPKGTSATEAAEIRQFIRSEVMNASNGDPGDAKGSGKLINLMKKDPRFTYAIFTAPPELSGLDDKMTTRVRKAALDHYVPDTYAEHQELVKARDHLQKGVNRMLETLGPKVAIWRAKDNKNLEELRKLA